VPESHAHCAEPIALGVGALLDPALLLERREDPEDVVLVQVQTLGQLGDAGERVLLESRESPQRVADRLDRVRALRPLHRVPSKGKGFVSGDSRYAIESGGGQWFTAGMG